MIDRLALEHRATERQAELRQEAAEMLRYQHLTTIRSALRARPSRLIGIALLTLTILGGSLLHASGAAVADNPSSGAGSGAAGYVP